MIYLILLLCFLPPPEFSVAVLALVAAKLLHRGMRHSAPLPKSLLLPLGVWFLFAALALMGDTPST